MPRKSGHVPSYRLHKPSGQARVIVHGQHIYLGRYGSSESREKYARIVAESTVAQENGIDATRPQDALHQFSVEELILSYWRFAEGSGLLISAGIIGDTIFGIAEGIAEAEVGAGVRGFSGVEVVEQVLHRSVETRIRRRVKTDP